MVGDLKLRLETTDFHGFTQIKGMSILLIDQNLCPSGCICGSDHWHVADASYQSVLIYTAETRRTQRMLSGILCTLMLYCSGRYGSAAFYDLHRAGERLQGRDQEIRVLSVNPRPI